MDPKILLQSDITVTWVAMYAKSGHWILLRHGDLGLKMSPSSYRLGPIELLAWPPSPKLDVQHVSPVSLIHANHSNLKLQTLW